MKISLNPSKLSQNLAVSKLVYIWKFLVWFTFTLVRSKVLMQVNQLNLARIVCVPNTDSICLPLNHNFSSSEDKP